MNTYLSKKQTRREKKLAMKRMFLSSTFRAGLMVFIAMFGTMYVLQTTAVSTKGYVISDLERSVQELKNETKRLEVDIAANSSMKSIQERLEGSELIAAAGVDYVNAVGTAVAQR
jgi:hypothetical protein